MKSQRKRTPTPIEMSWAAGLFEGEGTITIGVRKSDETYRLICTVANTDKSVLTFFHDRFDGWLQPAYGKRPGRKPAWSWTVAGPRAEKFLMAVRRYVMTERVMRKLCIGMMFRACQSVRKRDWLRKDYKPKQRALYFDMKELNKRGVR